MEKRRNFSSFPQYFQYISDFRSQITYSFVKWCCLIYLSLNSANPICRDTDISKVFQRLSWLRDNESRLYCFTHLLLWEATSLYQLSIWTKIIKVQTSEHQRHKTYLSDICAQRRFRSACAFAQSDQNLHWAHFGQPRMQSFFMRTMKTLIRLRGCAGWSESSMAAHVRRYLCTLRPLSLFLTFD